MTICASPEIVTCFGASPAAACRDAAGDGVITDAPGDTTIADARGETAVADTRSDTAVTDVATADSLGDSTSDAALPDAATSDALADASSDMTSSDGSLSDASADAPDAGVSADSGPLNPCGGYGALRYQGVDALPGARCGTCQDGSLVCASPNTLACSGQSTSDVCNSDVATPNLCGGMGPLYWRGAPAAKGAACGPCSGSLGCASSSALICGGTIGCDAGPNDNCDIPLSAYTASAPVFPAPPAETAPATTTATTITLSANWLVYNPFDFRLYASVASLQGTGGNAIAVIDPYSGTVTKSIYVGSEPRRMALSDDGKSLWVALDGSGSVRQVDLVSGTAGQQFRVGTDGSYGPWYADDLAVLPGTHNSVVLTRYSHGNTGTFGPVVYDDGVPRAYSVLGGNNPMLLIPTYSPQLLFGYNNRSTGYQLSTTCINANGVFVKKTAVPFTGFDLSFSFAENIVYTSSGIKYDIASATTLGTFAGRGPVAADAAKRRVYFVALGTPSTSSTVSAYNMDTLAAAGSESVPATLPNAPNTPALTNFVRWGRYGYAFRVNAQSIVVARSALVGSAP